MRASFAVTPPVRPRPERLRSRSGLSGMQKVPTGMSTEGVRPIANIARAGCRSRSASGRPGTRPGCPRCGAPGWPSPVGRAGAAGRSRRGAAGDGRRSTCCPRPVRGSAKSSARTAATGPTVKVKATTTRTRSRPNRSAGRPLPRAPAAAPSGSAEMTVPFWNEVRAKSSLRKGGAPEITPVSKPNSDRRRSPAVLGGVLVRVVVAEAETPDQSSCRERQDDRCRCCLGPSSSGRGCFPPGRGRAPGVPRAPTSQRLPPRLPCRRPRASIVDRARRTVPPGVERGK